MNQEEQSKRAIALWCIKIQYDGSFQGYFCEFPEVRRKSLALRTQALINHDRVMDYRPTIDHVLRKGTPV